MQFVIIFLIVYITILNSVVTDISLNDYLLTKLNKVGLHVQCIGITFIVSMFLVLSMSSVEMRKDETENEFDP